MTATVTTGRQPRNSDQTGAKRGQRSARPGSGRAVGSAMPEGRSAAAEKAYLRRQRRTGALREDGGPAVAGGDARALAKKIPFVALVLGILVAGMGLTLWLSTNSTGQSYELSAAKQQNEEMRNRTAALEQAVEAGNSAPELARKAEQLGMVQSRDVARIVRELGGAIRLEGTPLPADGPAPAPLTSARPGPIRPDPAPVPAPAPEATAPVAPVPPAPEAPAPEDSGPVEPPPAGEAPVPVPTPTHDLPLVEASDPGVGR